MIADGDERLSGKRVNLKIRVIRFFFMFCPFLTLPLHPLLCVSSVAGWCQQQRNRCGKKKELASASPSSPSLEIPMLSQPAENCSAIVCYSFSPLRLLLSYIQKIDDIDFLLSADEPVWVQEKICAVCRCSAGAVDCRLQLQSRDLPEVGSRTRREREKESYLRL